MRHPESAPSPTPRDGGCAICRTARHFCVANEPPPIAGLGELTPWALVVTCGCGERAAGAWFEEEPRAQFAAAVLNGAVPLAELRAGWPPPRAE